ASCTYLKEQGSRYMNEAALHQQLPPASQQIQGGKRAVSDAQGSDAELLDRAASQLQQADHALEQAQNEAGTEATENPQFQQAFEQLHDTRQQVQEAQQNNNDVL